jgi:hypothetical protein
MIYKVSQHFLNTQLSEAIRTTNGRLYARIEEIFSEKDLSSEQKQSLLKKAIGNQVAESFRDFIAKVKCFSKGLTFKK